jgi:hypothetical protein
MIDNAYDISYLLDAEPARVEMPPPRAVAAPKPHQPTPAEVQDAMARELLQASEIHEAMVQSFLRMYGPVEDDQLRH